MQIESFVLGMLSILILGLVLYLVVGRLKIANLEKKTDLLQDQIEESRKRFSEEANTSWDHFQTQLKAARHDLNQVEQALLNQIRIHQESGDKQIEQVRRYVDSRVDGMANQIELSLADGTGSKS